MRASVRLCVRACKCELSARAYVYSWACEFLRVCTYVRECVRVSVSVCVCVRACVCA